MGNWCIRSTSAVKKETLLERSQTTSPTPNTPNSDKIQNQKKLLLLGSGDSGKSTIFRQVKIMHGKFKDEEKLKYVPVIRGNILKGMKALIKASISFGIQIEDEENRMRAEQFLQLEEAKMGNAWDEMEERNIRVAEDLNRLWHDTGIQTTFERKADFQLDDCVQYYFTRLSAIGESDYQPTLEDIVKSRTKTTGIVDIDFSLGEHNVKLVDVGGQRNERKKWIHCFKNVSVLIYVVAIAEYDQNCYEDERTNRMDESLRLFSSTVNGPLFDNTAIVLFFNKVDLFREKIMKKDLNIAFPEYTGGRNFERAAEFIKAKFLELTPKHIPVVYTCATDDKEIEKAFEVVKKCVPQTTNSPPIQ
ncbi:guanine nucleotide-binding protein G(o) subunit alpha [Acrasis kona]|uniref:Guanine nucleotide-binding protein G(O) subunit alpha n=1 Tax=Acrasis kona TaxID=1008807 RepID=A0AAW2YTP5_9EUKA